MRFLDYSVKPGIDQRSFALVGRGHQLVGMMVHLVAAVGTSKGGFAHTFGHFAGLKPRATGDYYGLIGIVSRPCRSVRAIQMSSSRNLSIWLISA